MTQEDLNIEIIDVIKTYNKANGCVVSKVDLDCGYLEHTNGKIEASSYDCTITVKNNSR